MQKRTAEIKRAVFREGQRRDCGGDCGLPGADRRADRSDGAVCESVCREKRSKNILDYADLEHFALEILVQQKDGRLVRTDAARELSEQFREIMIDEYQDSNFIQEALLSAVSGEEEGRWNRFMVGDIKQSIYGFRLARPELFLENIIRMRRTGKASRESISTKTSEAGRRCLRRRIMYSAS